jgi:hypothetical protein
MRSPIRCRRRLWGWPLHRQESRAVSRVACQTHNRQGMWSRAQRRSRPAAAPISTPVRSCRRRPAAGSGAAREVTRGTVIDDGSWRFDRVASRREELVELPRAGLNGDQRPVAEDQRGRRDPTTHQFGQLIAGPGSRSTSISRYGTPNARSRLRVTAVSSQVAVLYISSGSGPTLELGPAIDRSTAPVWPRASTCACSATSRCCAR